MSIEQKLAKKRDLKQKIKMTEIGLHHLHPLDGLRAELVDAQRRIDSMRAKFGPDVSKWPRDKWADYNTAKATVDRHTATVNEQKGKKAQIEEQLQDLRGQLSAIDVRVTVDDLLKLQATHKDAVQRLERFQTLVGEEESSIAQNEQGNGRTLAQLTKEREDLLAAIACGESADQERLANLSREIAQEEALHDNHVNTLITSSQTISGLQRKIEQAQQELALAKKNYLDGLVLYLDQELDGVAEEYVQAALHLVETFSKVVSISKIMGECGAPKEVHGPYSHHLRIPAFLLDPCMSVATAENPGLLSDTSAHGLQDKIAAEYERLKELGIEIPA